jgi:hypothetical protein
VRAVSCVAFGSIACLSFVVLMVAAASGPVDVWHEPPPSKSSQSPAPTETVELEPIETPEALPNASDVSDNTLIAALVAIAMALLVISIVYALVVTLAGRFRFPRRRRGSVKSGDMVVLPEIEQPVVVLDVDAQLEALAQGSPRNAIVACWLRLEDDVAEAGLPRHVAETSAEFTTRVLGSYSIDPSPVIELAALYREARFSLHPMEQADRDRALVALRQVHAALAEPLILDPSLESSAVSTVEA